MFYFALGVVNVFLGGALTGMALILLAKDEKPLATTVAFAPICTLAGVASLIGGVA